MTLAPRHPTTLDVVGLPIDIESFAREGVSQTRERSG